MCGYQEICMILVLVCPGILQRNLADAVSTSALDVPKFRMTFVILYNNSGEDAVNSKCGKYYAETFLNNYIRTEPLLQNESSCGQGNRLKVALELKARVKLIGIRIELNTYINISLATGVNFNTVSMADIMDCSNVLNESLSNPHQLQQEYNLGMEPHYHIDLLRIPRNTSCEMVTLNPEQFIYEDGEWVCHDPKHYFSQRQMLCMPYVEEVPVTQPTSTKRPDTNIRKSTFIPATEYWLVQLMNNTNSLTLKEGNDPVTLFFKVAVNRTQLCGNSDQCKVIVSLKIQSEPADVLQCRTGETIPQVVFIKPLWGDSREVCSFTMDLNVTSEHIRNHIFTTERKIQLAPMLDGKYDGTQYRELSFEVRSIVNEEQGPSQSDALLLPIIIEDEDQKATCKSINDPHIATFDGSEYNNFYEGEFVLYEHLYLPYKVHVIYQKCGPGIPASCNCAVAIQSGDDVIVIDRCFRKRTIVNRVTGASYEYHRTIMTIDLYLNNDLTPGTTVFREADGMKYYVYLPHGGTVKVMVSGELLNVWVIASPKDKDKTTGLCGTYDDNRANDFMLRNKTVLPYSIPLTRFRIQPREFCVDWRVELYGARSIFKGVQADDFSESNVLPIFCDCSKDYPLCGYGVDVSLCDVLQGTDVTNFLIDRAKTPTVAIAQRKRRQANQISNEISAFPQEDPIDIDTSYIPTDPSWGNSQWTLATAQQFCLDYVKDDYDIGLICQQIPAVDFNQEITTCIEDIQITGNTTWANSARDAMKEQCLEEVQRNTSVPQDIALQVQNSICINDCSGHGICSSGTCQCEATWTTSDCSIRTSDTPYTSELPATGLCDTRYMNCKRVIVYGDDFISSINLTCYLQEAQVTDRTSDFKAQQKIITQKALYINFGAVECPIPDQRSYLVSVSNDGDFDHSSDPLLFIPFDSACSTCSTITTSCTKKKNSCIIDDQCFQEGDTSPNDPCLICTPHDDGLQWTTDRDGSCRVTWWENINIPNWVIALVAAVGGSLIGVIVGVILYKCCCKKRSQKKSSHHQSHNQGNHHHHQHHQRQHNNLHQHPTDSEVTDTDTNQDETTGETSPFEESMLHRNRGLPTFTDDRFLDIPFHHAEYEQNYSFPTTGIGGGGGVVVGGGLGDSNGMAVERGRLSATGRTGVQNGVDSTTYF